jgi:putative addiction module component (TIGR02574 family)
MTSHALREQVMALPTNEKLSLVTELWDSILKDEHAVPLDPEHDALLETRLAQELNASDLVSWEDARAEARRQVAARAQKRPD